ncbi:hypothetical protein [Effusibacillus pohliae]|uniref:hypothetical protein n=1 Tax=Effusibacillus pohliae TaxID=232270 RepID=UPI001B7F8002|nr:hypothetical protein [Effusibacillus pohliae]
MWNLISLVPFKGRLNELSDRAAMGLPEHYISCRIEGVQEVFSVLREKDIRELVEIVEGKDFSLEIRYTAGLILGLLGDPRIDVLNPTMITIPGSKAKIGLEPERVNEITQQYEENGIIAEWIEKETPAFEVEISTFKIAKYPVTNFEYLAFLRDNPDNEIPSFWKFGRYPFEFSKSSGVYDFSENS